MITLSRRKLLGGLGLLIAAPAIVRVASLMPVKAIPEVYEWRQYALGFIVTEEEISESCFGWYRIGGECDALAA